MIYLDNSATTRAFDEAAEAVARAMTRDFVNISSPYAAALKAEKDFRAAMQTAAQVLHARPDELILTSGGTESDNTALFCAPAGSEVILSAIEHPAVLSCQRALEKRGCRVVICPVNTHGRVEADTLASLVNENTGLVSIMHVNNEIGSVNDLSALVKAVKTKNPKALFHSDGVQAFMHVCSDMKLLGVDLYSVSAHKLHGPKGAGLLYVRADVPFTPYLFGGGQQNDRRSGTVNTPGALGFAAALTRLRSQEEFSAHLARVKEAFVRELTALPGARLICPDSAPHILSIAFEGVKASTLQNALENELIIGKGSACSSRSSRVSHVLSGIGLPVSLAESTLRLSFGAFNTPEEAPIAASLIKEKIAYLRKFQRK